MHQEPLIWNIAETLLLPGSKKQEGRPEQQDMTSCLYECLTEVCLQQHHARFTKMGVCCLAQLSTLTPEDYPVLGVHTMEDRTRLFHLIQLVGSVGHDDGHYRCHCDTADGDGAPEGWVVEGDMSQSTEGPNSSASVRRCLDFSLAAVDPKPFESSSEIVYQRRRSCGGRLWESSLPCCQSDLYTHFDSRASGETSEPRIPRRYLSSQSPRMSSSAGPVSTPKLFPNPKSDPNSRPNPSPNSRHNRNLNPRHKITGSNQGNKNKVKKGHSRAAEPGKCGKESSGTCRQMTKPTAVHYSDRATGCYNYGVPTHSPPSPNKNRQAKEQRICVCVRKRCLKHDEDQRGETDVVTTWGGECVQVHQSKEAVDLTHYTLQHRFYFDQVFGEESSNEEVYQKTAFPLVLHMLKGGQATCFAFGQTGAGKTHTMLGLPGGGPGLYALAARDIFTHLYATHTPPALLVYVSFLEIYCGQLYDLLDHRKRLFAREDGQGEVQTAGLREIPVDTVASLMEVICWGTERRTQGVSGVNPVSSRSHALLQIQLRSPEQQPAGRMWFVDLAGSERAVDSREPDRQTRIEGAKINQSLLALKECIRSLDQEQSHTPFRQSKLTQVLKNSFVGNSKTCMIANISPGHLATEHTLNTLRYADRVKELKEQGGVRGGGLRTKGTSLSKPNKTCSSSNGGNTDREKGSPKSPKFNHRDGPSAPPKLVLVAGGALCSTPKNSPRGEGRATQEQEAGIEHLTPVRCHRETLGPDAPSKRQPKAWEILCPTPQDCIKVRGSGIKDRVAKQDIGIEHLTRDRCPAEWRDGDERSVGHWSDSKDGDKRNPKERNDRRECINPIHPNSVTRPPDSQKARLRERREDLRKAGGREQEERLKWYHKQLQQLAPLAPLQSAHPSESSSISVSSSSNSPAVSASSSSSPKTSFSPVVHHDLKEQLNVYRAGIKIQTGVTSRHPDHGSRNVASPLQSSPLVKFLERSKITRNIGDAVGTRGLDHGILTKQQETADVEASYERKVEKSIEAAGAGKGREVEWAEGQRRWAWGTTTLTELLSLEVSEVSSTDPGHHWRTPHITASSGLKVGEEYTDANWMEGEHSYCDSNRHLNPYPHPEPAPDPAPAERPLSPAWEPPDQHRTGLHLGHLSLESKENNTKTTSNIVPPLLSRYPQQGVPLEIISERELGSTDFGVKHEIPNCLLSRPQYCPAFATCGDEVSSGVFNRCREHQALMQSAIRSPPRAVAHMHSLVKACDYSPKESSIGSLSCGMDPLSLSQPEVSHPAASESFLCGQNNTVSCFLKTEEEEVTRTIKAPFNNDDEEDVDGGTDLLWEKSETETSFPVTAPIGLQEVEVGKVFHRRSGTRGLGTTTSPITPGSPPAASHPDTVLIQHSWTAVPVGTQIPDTNPSTQRPSACQNSTYNQLPVFSIPTSQSESDLSPLKVGSKQSSLGSYHSNYRLSPHVRNDSSAPDNISPQGSLAGTTNRQHMSPAIHAPSPAHLEHAQWCVVKAHLVLLQQMECLCRKEETLMRQQHDLAFGDLVHRLEEILERRAWCVQRMRSQLQQYLKGPPNTSTTQVQQTI